MLENPTAPLGSVCRFLASWRVEWMLLPQKMVKKDGIFWMISCESPCLKPDEVISLITLTQI